MICISIANKDYEACRNFLLKEGFAELRLDLLDLSKQQVNDLFALPVRTIATCRPGKYSNEERLNLLKTAIQSGADYVDLEVEMDDDMRSVLVKIARENNCQVIISYHNFYLTPGSDELADIIEQCRECDADLVKIACKVHSPIDNVKLLTLYSSGVRLIVIGMGEQGSITRIAGLFLGAEFTYASTGPGEETAAGQFTADELRNLLKLLRHEKMNHTDKS